MTTEQHSHDVRPIVIQPQRSVATWIIAVALSVIATCLLLRPDPSFSGAAFGQTAMTGTHGIHAFTGQLDRDKYGLFMMDMDNSTVWVYEYYPTKHRLKLACARTFKYDRYLENHNNDDVTAPERIREMLERQQNRQNTGFSAPPVPTVTPAATAMPARNPTVGTEDLDDTMPAASAMPNGPVSASPLAPRPDVQDPDAAAADALGDDAKIETVGSQRDSAVETAPGQAKNP